MLLKLDEEGGTYEEGDGRDLVSHCGERNGAAVCDWDARCLRERERW